ncbi:alpha/beta hydrolase [Phytomonospora sp. NPDC050363]|uniref:alpha/beta hydrolase n=1 Tax=Phytomonospora sp. NPDC050363 TaxID=3155642 RepID=UPI0033EF735A
MVTYMQLRNAQTTHLESAAGSARKVAREMEQYGADTRRNRRALNTGWRGTDASAADAQLGQHESNYQQIGRSYGRVDEVVGFFANEIDMAKRTLERGVDVANAIPGRVSESGAIQVDWAAFGPRPSPEVIAHAKQQATQAANLIRQALMRANSADRQAQSALQSIVAPTMPNVSGGSGTIPQRGTDPRQVNDWWKGLTDEQRAAHLRDNPKQIGSLDGIPAVARDEANRLAIGQERDWIESRREYLRGRLEELRPDDGSMNMQAAAQMGEVNKELRDLDTRWQNLDSLEHQLGRTDLQGSTERMYLLNYESAADGQAVISVGNPDTADSVVTYVPGTTADVPGINGDVNRALWMQADATAADPGRRTAAITWLGYDAPDKVFPNAISNNYYEAAADDLASFQQGLRATHEGSPSINTLMGHSYGASTIGYTAARHDLGIDNLVSVASAGSSGTANEYMGIGADHVWATRASDDPIRFAAGVHGTDPINESYGGRVFPASDGGHSGYWDSTNVARGHFANIVTGHYDRVPAAPQDRWF